MACLSWLRTVLLGVLLGLHGAAWTQAVQAIPALTTRVIDTTGTLSAEQKQALENRLSAFESAKGTQIAVLMVPTTAPEDIVDYTQRVGDAWKIGRKDVGDGLLLIIAKNDRTLRIATAKALEGAVPDLAARQVIQNTITPRFRAGDYAAGIEAGLIELMARISGERLPEPTGQSSASAPDWNGLLIFLFVLVPVLSRLFAAMLGRRLGSVVTGAATGFLAWVLGASWLLSLLAGGVATVLALVFGVAALQGGHWSVGHGRRSSGWSSGSSWPGGGGFRSGGGGDFGGGGASGRW